MADFEDYNRIRGLWSFSAEDCLRLGKVGGHDARLASTNDPQQASLLPASEMNRILCQRVEGAGSFTISYA
jgi:hypothetical protein